MIVKSNGNSPVIKWELQVVLVDKKTNRLLDKTIEFSELSAPVI